MGSLRSLRPRSRAPEPEESEPERNCVGAFERELDYLYATLQRLGAPPADVDDLLQDVFVVLHRHWPTLDLTRPLRPWLFGVAFRVVRAHRRRRAREAPWAGLDPEDTGDSPDRQLESHESLAILWAALEHVPSARRSVVMKHDLDGLDIVDIARELSMTKFGVYARLYKGRKELASAVRRLAKGGVQT
ncbi:MAG TPA: sigma-70 family RNA polymerase sigma factor [Polyangiaceae bacterium]|nr:sigma-70 family RNA polymerase sigma factor [Polyangiaceae bacterium]